MAQSMLRLSVGDTAIDYEEHGAGEPIVLVHAGALGDWFLPLSQSPSLNGFRVIRVRRPGYGPQAPDRHVTLADHASCVAAVAEELDLGAFHMVGHSSSCQIALELAIQRPELVHSLILLEPAAGGGFAVPASEQLGRDNIGPAMAAFSQGDVETAFDTFMRGVCGAHYRQALERTLGPDGYEHAVADSAYFFRDEIVAVLQSQFGPADGALVSQPVLVVEGGDGPNYGPLSRQITERATALLPHAEVAIVPGVGHAMPLEDPDAVARTIATFARGNPIF